MYGKVQLFVRQRVASVKKGKPDFIEAGPGRARYSGGLMKRIVVIIACRYLFWMCGQKPIDKTDCAPILAIEALTPLEKGLVLRLVNGIGLTAFQKGSKRCFYGTLRQRWFRASTLLSIKTEFLCRLVKKGTKKLAMSRIRLSYPIFPPPDCL